jgi:trans-aconitate methyltransferase
VSTTEADFYDVAMTEEGSPAMLPLEMSPWLPLYEEACSWIPAPHPVVDLGCGTGRFIECLLNGINYGAVEGVDFSPSALREAARISTYGEYGKHDVMWTTADLRNWEPDPNRQGNTTYVALEVLEHLEDDLYLVRRIPPGHQLVFSVPNYESESHVRTFRNAGDIWARYANLLEFRRWSLVSIDDRKSIHVVDSVRRTDSW